MHSSSSDKRLDVDQHNIRDALVGTGTGSMPSSSIKSKSVSSEGNQAAGQQQNLMGGGMMSMAPHPMQYMHSNAWGSHQQQGMPPAMMGMNGGQPVSQGPLHYMPPPPHMPQWGMFQQPMGMPSDIHMTWQQSDPSGVNNEKDKRSNNSSPAPSNRKSDSGSKSKSSSVTSNKDSNAPRSKESSNNSMKLDNYSSSRDNMLNQQLHMGNVIPPWAQAQMMMPGPNHMGATGMPTPMMIGMVPTPDQMMMNNGKTTGNMYPQHMMSPETWMGHPIGPAMGAQVRGRQSMNGIGNSNMLCKASNGVEDMDAYMMKSPTSKGEKGRGNYRCGRCGVPKKGHICPYQPKLKRRADEPPPEMRNAAIQVEIDEYMVMRRLNLEIQGFPETYLTDPQFDMVGAEAFPRLSLSVPGVISNDTVMKDANI